MSIKCNECVSEVNGKCIIKKVAIKPNKTRKCNEFEFDQTKEIARLERKARVLDNQERAFASKQAAIQAAQAKEQAHPTTGNLDRFKTTASE